MKSNTILLLLAAGAGLYFFMQKNKGQGQQPGQEPKNAPENNPGNVFVRDIDASKPTDGLISIKTGEDTPVYSNPNGNTVVYLESENASYSGNLSGVY